MSIKRKVSDFPPTDTFTVSFSIIYKPLSIGNKCLTNETLVLDYRAFYRCGTPSVYWLQLFTQDATERPSFILPYLSSLSFVEGRAMSTPSPQRCSSPPAKPKRSHVVDYSYFSLTDLESIRSTDLFPPRSGLAVKRKQKPNAVTQETTTSTNKKIDKKEIQSISSHALFFGSGTGKTHKTSDGLIVMRAKDETYAYKDSGEDPYAQDKEMHRWVLNADGILVERKDAKEEQNALLAAERLRFHCTSLRLNNNDLESFGNIVPITQTILYKPLENLSHLDLSVNRIAQLPDNWGGLPIHTLLLHSNRIASLVEVKKLQSLHASLRKLTLNGNPIQETTKRYKYTILHLLPFLLSFDDVRVTMKDRERMDIFEHIFVKPNERGTTVGLLPPIIPRSKSQLGVLGEYF